MPKQQASNVYENYAWPYDQALEWMSTARAICKESNVMSLGVGAHDKPLITLGRHAGDAEIRDAAFLRDAGVEVFTVDRGGGATYHGPGQIVLYPVVNLHRLSLSVPDFTCLLEIVLVHTLHDYGIEGTRVCGEPGVFVRDAKIGAIGLHISQGIVTHGLSLNVNNTLEYYSRFRPCRKDVALVTSMSKELGRDLDLPEIALSCAKKTNTAIREGWRYSET